MCTLKKVINLWYYKKLINLVYTMRESRQYSNIEYGRILEEMGTIIRAKQGPLADFSEGSYGRSLMELWAASTDMNNYWINRSFEESFLETARNESSIYAGARSIGYSVRRPVPSKAMFGIRITRTGRRRSVNVEIKKDAVLTMGDVSLLAIDNVKFTITPDRNENANETGIMTVVKNSDGYGKNILIEGELKTKTFFSTQSKFQEFYIDDTSFSDWYGDRDPNMQDIDERKYRHTRFTQLITDIGLVDDIDPISMHGDKLYWRVSRRGFNDPGLYSNKNTFQLLEDGDVNKNNYTALFSTANDGTVKIEFADGLIGAIPTGTITVKYLSTNGAEGIRNNVFNTQIQVNNPNDIIITDENGRDSDLTINDLDIRLLSDLQGGLNIESVNSIKRNAPSVYSNLDTLGTRDSHILFLKSNMGMRYARAYGEDKISKIKDGKVRAKYINVVRYSVLKSLYGIRNGNYYLVDEKDYQVDGYKVSGLSYQWEYDYKNLYTPDASDVTSIFKTHIDPSFFIDAGSELDTIQKALERRGYMTVEYAYIPPFVHHFDLKVDLTLYSGTNFSNIKEEITSNIYGYLSDYTDFSTPIYKSKIINIIEEFPEVSGVNVSFKPVDNGFSNVDLTESTWFASATTPYITDTLDPSNIEMNFQYRDSNNEQKIISFTLPNSINALRSPIDSQIKSIGLDATNGFFPKTKINESDVNNICGFIWHRAMNEVYLKLAEAMNQSTGEDASDISDIIFIMRTWSFNDGYTSNADKIIFDSTNVAISNLLETSGNLYKYISYTLEYIKLVRNVFRNSMANGIINVDINGCGTGDLTEYSTSHEIAQVRILPDNITIRTET